MIRQVVQFGYQGGFRGFVKLAHADVAADRLEGDQSAKAFDRLGNEQLFEIEHIQNYRKPAQRN